MNFFGLFMGFLGVKFILKYEGDKYFFYRYYFESLVVGFMDNVYLFWVFYFCFKFFELIYKIFGFGSL